MKDNRYYAGQFPQAIYDTRPIPCGETRGYEVHILTCERDRTMAFWALKSFYHFIEERPPLVVHDDGSLSPESFRLFDEHFPGCTVIAATTANEDSRLRDALKPLPLCDLWRYRCDFQLAKKLFDFAAFAGEPYVIGIDSDILFFRKASAILECASGRVPFMSSDYQEAYDFDNALIQRAKQDFELVPRLNSGLFGLNVDAFDFHVVERLLEACVEAAPAKRFQFWKGWLEQTMLASLFSRSAGGRVLELSSYQISSMLLNERTISQHFVNDGSRSAFFTWGLRRLDETGFIAAAS